MTDSVVVIDEQVKTCTLKITYRAFQMKDMGHDLSDSFQGAGGIGGLLSATFNSTSTVFYTFDGNGNVTDLTSQDGTVVANYQYDPFGKLISATGNAGTLAANNYLFSTKYQDRETGLLYYGYRYLSPELGRWVSRDPIGEEGQETEITLEINHSIDRHSYAFCRNNPNVVVDSLGLFVWNQTPGRCGPDFTEAFKTEIYLFREYLIGMPPWPKGANVNVGWGLNRKGIEVLLFFKTIALLPDYVNQEITCKREVVTCPEETQCQDTLTICGKCVDSDVTGNLMFGLVSELFGIPETTRNRGAYIAEFLDLPGELRHWNKPEFIEPPEDIATFDLGRSVASGVDLCSAIRALPEEKVKTKKECCLCGYPPGKYRSVQGRFPKYPDWRTSNRQSISP